MATLAASAAAGGTTISEGPSSGSDNLWHIDIGVSFDSVGMGANAVNSGAGTVRITLPGIDADGGAFDPSLPAEPFGYSCHAGTGSYGVPGTGFECINLGQASASGLTFPADMTLHLTATDC